MTVGTSRMFKSTDFGAPALSNNAGSLIALLDAVLVNGYGSKSSLGWTKEFSATNKAVYRMKAGTRMFLYIDDSIVSFISGTYAMYAAEVRAYVTMLDINNGVDRIPPASGTDIWYITKGFNVAGNFQWWVIGDEAGFYICTNISNTAPSLQVNAVVAHYFGDYCAWDIRNKWNFIMIPSYYGVGAHPTGIHPHAPLLSIPNVVLRGSSFARGIQYIGLLPFNGNLFFGTNNIVSYNSIGNYTTQKINDVYMKSSIHIYETVNSQNLILGNLPGIYEPLMVENSYSVVANVAPMLAEETTLLNGNTELLIRAKHGNGTTSITTGKLIFSIGGGFRNVQ